MLRLARASWAACLATTALATGGCLAGSSSLPTSTTLTLITADPSAFTGTATCGTRLRKYVVTLTDVTKGLSASYSSGPTPCTELVSFAGPPAPTGTILIVGDSYIASVDGYDRDDIRPELDGARRMVDLSDTPQEVVPRWTTTCGRAPASSEAGQDAAEEGATSTNPLFAPVQAKALTEVFLLGCIPFSDPMSQADGGAGATDDASQDGG